MNRGDALFAGMVLLLAGSARLAIGKHIDGKRRSDCTFWRPGTHAEPHWWSRGDPKWPLLPGWKRAACWWTALGVTLGLRFWRTGTEWLLVVTVGPAAGLLAVRAIRAWYGWQHYVTRIQPLHVALAPVLDIPLATSPKTWLKVPADYATNKDAQVIIHPPANFTAGERDQQDIARTVAAKLPGIEAPDVKWKLDGQKPRIIFTHSEPPPGDATWDDIAAAVEAAAPEEMVIGLGRKRAVVKPSLSKDSPHMGLNMGSGGGKTNLASLLMLQRLHRGDIVLIIDYKMISYPWARGLPNVAYASRIPEIHGALAWFGGELHRRNDVALAGLQPSGAIYADVGPRIFSFLEELNFTVEDLKEYWSEIRDKSDPKRSPAFSAVRKGAFAGRQVWMHEVFIGQMITAAVTGSSDSSVRGNIGTSVMARYNEKTWRTMTDKPMPPPSGVPGRMQVVTAGGIQETQVPYLHLDDPDEDIAAAAAAWARDYATSGVVGIPPHDMPFVGGGVLAVPGRLQLVQGASDLGVVPGTSPVVPALPPTAVTLAQACDLGILRCKKSAAQKRSQRPGFPESIGWDGPARIWDALDLQAYEDGKVRVLR